MISRLSILLLLLVAFVAHGLSTEEEIIENENNISNEIDNEENSIAEEEEIITEEIFGNMTREISEETTIVAGWNPPKYNVKKAANVRPGRVVKAMILPKPFKKAIVTTHNRLRSIAKPTATNMRKMSWDFGLERIATQYTRKCIYEHNPDPKHSRFDYVGENLFISIGLPYNKNLLTHAIEAWDGEKTVYDYETRKCVPGKMCGHYTQVVWADTFKVGCGATVCTNINVRGKIWKNAVLFACNYGPGGNYPTHPFVAGKSCSGCDPTDKCQRNLCTNRIRDRPKIKASEITWSKWSAWTPCTKSCGIGSQKRSRKCSTFVPSDCKGFASEVKFCFKRPCANFGGSFSYNIFLNQGDHLLKNSLQSAINGGMRKQLSGR